MHSGGKACTGGTRIIQLVRFVILARLLSPHDFGLLAVAWTVVEVGQGLSDWGLWKALVQRPHVSDHEYNAAWTFDFWRCATLSTVIGVSLHGLPCVREPRRRTLFVHWV